MKIEINNNNQLGISSNDQEINALTLAESFYFNKQLRLSKLDYRQRALELCVNSRVEFNSTANNLWNITKQYLKTVCPYCGSDMGQATNQGGSSDTATVRFTCSCGASISLHITWDSITINPPKESD